MSRLFNTNSANSPTPPDASIEAELRSYFAVTAAQPPTIEAFWQRLAPQLEAISMSHETDYSDAQALTTLDVSSEAAHSSSMSEKASTITPLKKSRSPFQRRMSALGAIAAVLALVVIFALVLHSFLGFRSIPSKIATQSQSSSWKQTVQFSTHKSALDTSSVIVELNDPNVIYELSTPKGLTFWRSDDGGKTWHTLSFPDAQVGGDPLVMARLSINPLDAHMVWANLIVGPEDPACHPGPISTGCTFAYVSTNGGTTWVPEQMPDGLILGFGSLGGLDGGNADGFIYAQGSRLYTQLSSGDPDPAKSHLATSLDGIHWSIVDHQLTAHNLVIMEFAATPTGSTIFATTASQSAAFPPPSKREFWRSDDAGAHWADLGAFPQGYTHLLGAANVNGTTLVYYSYQDSQDNSYGGIKPHDVFVSANSGKTWQEAPSKNAPSGLQVGNELSIATLANGAVVMLFDKSVVESNQQRIVEAAAVYSWRPGEQSWTQLSQDLKMSSDGSYSFQGLWYTPAHDGIPAKLWELTPYYYYGPYYLLWSCSLG